MTVTSTTRRAFYLATAATSLALAVAPANAQSADLSVRDAQDGSSAVTALSFGASSLRGLDISQAEREAQAANTIFAPVLEPQTVSIVRPEPEIAIAGPNTPTTARDPVNITGIAQMVIDQGGGFVGLCTGSLINPRTILFAAHCVNSRAATEYGAASGGTAIAFGFETNTRANAAGQTDELVRWLLGGAGGAGKYQTNLAQAFFNVNQVRYNTLSLEPAAQLFLYGDVATATLDTPAAGIPTWALLFSPLTNTGTIGAAGTGFNVGIVGYGRNGTGEAGTSTAIDFRRRAAENILGALTDLQTFELFLFGGAPNGLTQNLYFLDFDDPRRGTPQASPFDFNAFRDNARAGANGGASREGITSNGDSGGPLILQNFSQQLVIGVLSGGYTRFFNGQPANGYGTVAFYQPLYLYWDWIAANNPYHYVSATAGDGLWTDPNHWVTTLDPTYFVLGANGQPVNGIPTDIGQQKNGTTGDFGQICFQSGGVSDCLDTRTNVETVENRPIGTVGNNAGTATVANNATTVDADGTVRVSHRGDGFDGVERESQAEGSVTTQALPAATLANGLPGATNFVPNNADPVRATGVIGRYFDVTLTAAGTTTLTGASVTIDRLTLGANNANLTVAASGSLSSLININHFAGTLAVDGTVSSVGDYSFFGGLISGSGRINAPFLTSVLGQFAPGTTTTVGTLTVGGNLVLASGTSYFVNLGASGTSDRIAVVANGTSTGAANIGGTVIFSPATGTALQFGSTYTILTAQGGVTGTFGAAAALSAILRPTFTYSANQVNVQITAVPYLSVVNAASQNQVAYARLLDANRVNYSLLADLYGPLDLLTQAQIQATLESAAPRTEATMGSLLRMSTDAMGRFYRDRISFLASGESGGTLTMIGNPIQLASNAMNNVGDMQQQMSVSDGASNLVQAHGVLPDHVSAFLAGGLLDGRADPMPSLIATGRDELDGWYVSGGLEFDLTEGTRMGVAIHYVNTDGQSTAAQTVDGSLVQGNFYSVSELGGGLIGTTQLNVGEFSARTRRQVVVGGTTFNLRGRNDGLAASGEVGLGYQIPMGGLTLTPHAAGRYTLVDFGDNRETGGGLALVIEGRRYESVQGRIGVDLGGTIDSGSVSISPRITANWIHEFNDQPGLVLAGFAATGLGFAAQNFILPSDDRNWGEIGGGLRLNAGRVSIDLSADTTVARGDLSYRTYRAGLTVRF